MKIIQDSAVSMHYTLKNAEGQILDSSEGKEPLQFLFGKGLIIPGLEKALEGKEVGDTVDVTVAPEEGYGTYNEKLIGEVKKELFDDSMELKPGMPVQAQNENGTVQVFMVREIKDDMVVLDGNHPLAGMELNFHVEISEVREATSEELEHGHVHA